MDLDELRPLPIFAGMPDAQAGDLLAAGQEVGVAPGEVPFRQGEHADSWWVLIEGALDLVRRVGREDVVVGRMDVPGRWAGGFRAFDAHGVYLATGVGAEPSRLLCVPVTALRELSDAWFPLGGHLIEGVLGTARTIEATVRQRESLITLGTLAAGLAHEINNPAAATVRAVDGLTTESDTMLTSLWSLATGAITGEQLAGLDALRRELVVTGPGTDPLATADREDALAEWMTRQGVEGAWEVASPLAAGGADPAWCRRVADALPDEVLGAGLTWVASTMMLTILLAEVRESSRRVSDLVSAVKSYSQMDRAGHQSVELLEGIESTLTILGHRLREVDVERVYAEELPRVDGYPGELNQVWTNLVDNAVDAMDGSGTLRLEVRPEGDGVVVEVGDTGPGMAPEVVARAFEAFFTTKDVGKGTGLGLDIARRIVVERHGGSIDVDSSPAGTTMRVRLPLGRG